MINKELLLESVESYLKSLISEISGSSIEHYDSKTPFQELGIDSFRVLQIIKKLEEDFGTLPKTLLFENFNISDLSQYFVGNHEQTILSKFANQKKTSSSSANIIQKPIDEVKSIAQIQEMSVIAEKLVKSENEQIKSKSGENSPIIILEKDALNHPELGKLVFRLFNDHKNEGSASRGTRNIAPNIFIGSNKLGYFNFSRYKNIVLVYSYTGPHEYFSEISTEMYQFCSDNNFELSIFAAEQVTSVGDVPFTATPFGVFSRVENIGGFSLEGNKMKRLRYLVSKFENSGNCKTEEYKCGTNKKIDQSIADMIDLWSAPRTMVNPLIYIVKQEILDGKLDSGHRLFITTLNNVLQNVILISRLSDTENGYLMDLEFYPKDMPLGGLEYAIVNIIKTISGEGHDILSLGGTYGCKLEPSTNADPHLDKALNFLREQKIFNDEGNLQFKNKFRPVNNTIYLCRVKENSNPDNVTDIIMMIADPSKMQASKDETNIFTDLAQLKETKENVQKKQELETVPPSVNEPKQSYLNESSKDVMIEGNDRSAILAEFGYNPFTIPNQYVEFDLKTDSWGQLDTQAIENQTKYLHTQLQRSVNLDEVVKSIFPFSHFVLTKSGRTAERAFCKSWDKKGTVLQNLLFPTTIFNQIENGFSPKEIPAPTIFKLNSEELNKGELNLEDLKKQVAQPLKSIAFVLIEVDNNAAGGASISIEHLKQVKTLLSKHAIPLVLDATRIVENARFIIDNENNYSAKDTWDVVHEIFSYADAVIASLMKDFGVEKGGIVATNDKSLYTKVRQLILQEGVGLDAIDNKTVALALSNKNKIETQVIKRISLAQKIGDALINKGVPVVRPVGSHCILIDVKQLNDFSKFEYPVASFVAWMFLNTGIRSGEHNVGMQKNTLLNNLVRLAIPVGTTQKQAEEIISRLQHLFERMENIPEIVKDSNAANSIGKLDAGYILKGFHNLAGNIIPKTTEPSFSVENKEVVLNSHNHFKSGIEDIHFNNSRAQHRDIAVVGIAGRYSKAKNIRELWRNIVSGRDCVHEIPESRLAQRRKYGFDKKYRGGFIDDIDKFDSLFFNISPREAEIMDPQERLFLEVAWEAIEDAGYYPEILGDESSVRDIGVFVGAVWAMYQMTGVDEKLSGNEINPNSFLWSIANRVSYWMNLSGPSFTVDTACSSSLTALYLACEAIQKGDCSSAIVGGVNLDLHQSKFDINSAGGALSKDGVCRSFGHGANGYVAGEGVGAVYIKPLDKAISDGDNIYGVIKSAAVNHGGKSSGYMVTNPKAQTNLILSALEKANIDARSIGYIEAHGTGTELGDPVEISGLKNAFDKHNVSQQSCPIGSIKTNIGHLEAAAGIVGLSKILLQMQHNKLVPSLHSSKLNEYIDFENSPFYVIQNVEDWGRKSIDGENYPLRAGISSFGAGGANAHVIIEKYEPQIHIEEDEPAYELIFPLSARNEEQLHASAVQLKEFIVSNLEPDKIRVQDIAHTLQIGRKSFDFRMAILAKNSEELVERLTNYIERAKDENVFSGQKQNANSITELLSRREKEEFINIITRSNDYSKVAKSWVDGLLNDWSKFNGHQPGQRISMPTYPFAGKRHWAAENPAPGKNAALSAKAIHPLIDSNESTFEQQLFKKTFNKRDIFIQDYQLYDAYTLPRVALLELARKAGELATCSSVYKLTNLEWDNAIFVDDSEQVESFIELMPDGNSVAFEIYNEQFESEGQSYLNGTILIAPEIVSEPETIDISGIQSICKKTISGNDLYTSLKSHGLNVGGSFQVISEVSCGDNEIFGTLKLNELQLNNSSDYIIHPSLMDGAIQALFVSNLGHSAKEVILPKSVREIEIYSSLSTNCYCYIKDVSSGNADEIKCDIYFVNEEGRILVKITGFVGISLSNIQNELETSINKDGFSKLYYHHKWEKTDPIKVEVPGTILLFDYNEKLRNNYKKRYQNQGKTNNHIVLVKPGSKFEQVDEFTFKIAPQKAKDFDLLFKLVNLKSRNITKICYQWAINNFEANEEFLDNSLNKGVYSLLNISQALIEQKTESKVQIIYPYVIKKGEPQPQNEAVYAFGKTLQLEHPKLTCKVVEVVQDKLEIADLLNKILAECSVENTAEAGIRYEGSNRFVRKLVNYKLDAAINVADSKNLKLKEEGVYIITGGAGGLGLIFAEYLAKQCKARLIISGRSGLSHERKIQLEKLQDFGSEVIYIPRDVSKREDVVKLIEETKSQYGNINGIIHSAGVLRDSFIRNKTRDEMEAVLASKVYGTVYLDEETKNEPLDFFVLFSSLAAVSGNIGQCDYAFANHFMDSFADRREYLNANGERFGKTLSLNWSLWADGGMHVDMQTEQLLKNLGMKPLSTQAGVKAFTKSLSFEGTQLAVVEGIQDKIEVAWGLRKKETPSAAIPASKEKSGEALIPSGVNAEVRKLIEKDLAQLVMDLLKLEESDFTSDGILTDLGFDSIGLTQYANEINKVYQTGITPVLFFERPSIKDISDYLYTEHKAEVMLVHQLASTPKELGSVSSNQSAVKVEKLENKTIGVKKRWRFKQYNQNSYGQNSHVLDSESRFVDQPIAIIGISGVMPQSENLEEFWENLENAKDLVSLIPKDRWSWEEYFGDPFKEANKSNSNWGGFMKEIDKFDPLFFGISPREAEMMDPQQRIFLEAVWKAIEDSGHKVSELSGTKTGLFAGLCYKDYVDLMTTSDVLVDGYSASGNATSILTNRISFLLNLRGPSAPIDTACSSSLVALHRAIESIHTGSSDMAIVGGVQVILTPAAHITLSVSGMMSPDGKCKTFDKDANGYVRGEGVGAILIKPLSKAEEDGDHIYAVIKSTAENHGGRVTTLTAPNPNAQAELLIEAYDKAKVDPSTVGYIECHGTGTSLGDPIEIMGLKKSFSELYKRNSKSLADKPHCGLSSVKTNIGHLEAAAGIAGLLKALLAIRFKKIPALIHYNQINPYIELENSPFYIVDKTREWEAFIDENGNILPRRAGVSSFGFGGSNAHIVLEEYLPKNKNPTPVNGPQIIVLSAKNKNRLKEYAELMIGHIQKYGVNLADFAYTLQVGRDAMEERLGLIVNSVQELEENLKAFVQGKLNDGNSANGRIDRKKDISELINLKEYNNSVEVFVEKNLSDKSYKKLLEAWVKGLDIDWKLCYSEDNPRRISLPTYPFARERYWMPGSANQKDGVTQKGNNQVAMHPLLHQNTSTFSEQKYTTVFTGHEFYLKDHVVKGTKVLPGVAYLEMARKAIEHAGELAEEGSVLQLKNVVWARPISVNGKPVEINIGLFTDDSGDISYEIYSEPTESLPEFVIHSRGTAQVRTEKESLTIDLAKLRSVEAKHKFDSKQCYEIFNSVGLSYGSSFRGIDEIYVNNDRLLAKIRIPESALAVKSDFMLHPSIMDAALQSSIGFALALSNSGETKGKASLPFALDELTIYDKCSANMWAVVERSAEKVSSKIQKLNMDICDETGKVAVRLKGFTSRVLDGEVGSTNTASKEIGTVLSEPKWEASPLTVNKEINYEKHLVVLCEPEEKLVAEIENKLPGISCIALQNKEQEIDKRFGAYALKLFGEIKQLIASKPKNKVLVQVIVPKNGEKQLFSGLTGLLKTTEIENPKLICQLIETDDLKAESIARQIAENVGMSDKHIAYEKRTRFVSTFSYLSDKDNPRIPWKEQGVYIITGGAGGLGLIFAKDIAEKTTASTIVLTGRSKLGDNKLSDLSELEKLGTNVVYKSVNVGDKASVKSLISDILKEFGKINGIIHSAGVIRDNFIVNKSPEEYKEVLVSKVNGAVNIDEAIQQQDIDFVILFASIAGVFGNMGQSDYAAANAFMDAFAAYRNELVKQGKRKGRTLSINWPLWKNGGMQIGENSEEMIRKATGMLPMSTENGLKALYAGISSNSNQVAVIEGELNRVKTMFSYPKTKEAVPVKEKTVVETNSGILEDKIQQALVKSVSELLKIDTQNIDTDTELNEYGFDSISLTRFTNDLNEEYRLDLNPTVFFEHTTISSLSTYFATEYKEVFEAKFGSSPQKANVLTEIDSSEAVTVGIDGVNIREKVQTALVKDISDLLRINTEGIDLDTELNEYGFDSISLTRFTNELNEKYHLDLNPTVFFDYTTISSLSEYLVTDFKEVFESKFGGTSKKILVTENVETKVTVSDHKKHRRHRFSNVAVQEIKPDEKEHDSLAIVGISCKFPMAGNVEEYWNNLSEGKDCISEIPQDRWDWKEYYGDPTKEINKTNVKWGGFIDGVREFDPLFFGISPREAKGMDPQQRLLMTHVWAVIEDAGHSTRSISGTNTGLFIGTGTTGYGSLLERANKTIEGDSATSLVPSVGPNRMSYFLDLHGPSEPIETACSSSLVAIHKAINAIQNGDCEMAIAGGVNTLLVPDSYISFTRAGMLCEDGRCKTFSDKANGYVRGEGVGMIFLKKLSKAKQDGDHIYGIVKGSAINHGGRASSLTAPNPKAQVDLLKTAYKRAGINPKYVSYIEAHGTGTLLGDTVEINALRGAFSELTKTNRSDESESYCGIGAVKTNIGHLEFASGIAGIIKVLMQMKHGKLVKSINCNTINPYIKLNGSPFYIVQEQKEWKRLLDENGNEVPRVAGVSSFGFGGVNAHIVLEEYIEKEESAIEATYTNKPAIMVLSAKNEERLKSYAGQLLGYINGFKKKNTPNKIPGEKYISVVEEELLKDIASIINIDAKEISTTDSLEDCSLDPIKLTRLSECINERYTIDINLSVFKECDTPALVAQCLVKEHLKVLEGYYGNIPDVETESRSEEIDDPNNKLLTEIAYTLQVGRKAMEERMAIVVMSLKELQEKLQDYVNGKENIDALYRGQVGKNKEMISVFNSDEDISSILEVWISKGKYAKFIDLWVKGLSFDWNKLYHEVKPRRISLPTYPFAKDQYWVDALKNGQTNTFANSGHVGNINSTNQNHDKNIDSPESGNLFFSTTIENSIDKNTLTTVEKIERFLQQEIAMQMEVPVQEISKDKTFLELGVSSLGLITLIQNANQLLDENISPSVLFEYDDIAKLSSYLYDTYPDKSKNIVVRKRKTEIRNINKETLKSPVTTDKRIKDIKEKAPEKTTPNILVPIQSKGNNPPMFAVPGADGGVLSFLQLSQALGNKQPFYGLEAVGLNGDVKPLKTIEEMAKVNLAAIQSVQPKGPYCLFGYSNGGVIAYEMARLLLEKSEQISSLILLDSLSPTEHTKSLIDPIELVVNVCENIIGTSGASLDFNQFKQIPENDRGEYVFNVLNNNGINVSKEQFVKNFNLSFEMSMLCEKCCLAYKPIQLSQEVEVILFRATGGYKDMPEDYGWNKLLLKPIRVFHINANHFNLIGKEHIQEIPKLLSTAITPSQL